MEAPPGEDVLEGPAGAPRLLDRVRGSALGSLKKEAGELPASSLLNLTKKTAFNKSRSFIVEAIFGGLSQFFEKVYDQTFDLIRVDKGEKDWTN